MSTIETVQLDVTEGEVTTKSTGSTFHDIVSSMKQNLVGVEELDQQIIALVDTIIEIGQATSKVAKSAEELNEAANNA